MKRICILDPLHNIPGLTLLFPEADYYAYEPDQHCNYYWTNHMNVAAFESVYKFRYRTDWDSIRKESYDVVFCVMPLLDAIDIPKQFPLKHTPDAIYILNKMYNILRKQRFERTVLFDTYDYDYDPSVFPNQPIDIFFKRNYNKHNVYNTNVYPFPCSMFVFPCVLMTMLKSNPTLTTEGCLSKHNEIFWCGSIYNHKDAIYCPNGKRDRETIYNKICHRLSVHKNIPGNQFISTLSNYKLCLDLCGVGDPNKRTFEILSSGSLWFSNITDLKWPFEEGDAFPEEAIFSTAEECFAKADALLWNDELYISVLEKQQALVKKYFNRDFLRKYIISHI
jgi:hypothetical protein